MTQPSCTARVPAKINLGLSVGGRREDGFHSLATVYQAVDLQDEVRATARADSQLTVKVVVEAGPGFELSPVPTGDDNLAIRAAKALRSHLGDEQLGADLAIRKVIPVAGGMAGGSADAVGALVACNAVWGAGLGRDELEKVAADIGSDVPFLLHGQSAIGGGRGELVSPVLASGSYLWVVAIAARGLSTPAVFAEFDRLQAGVSLPEPRVSSELLLALRSGEPEALGDALSNDLQPAALSLRPELADTLGIGRQVGALGAIVSGSGPTTLFLAGDEQHALDISMALAAAQVCADVVTASGPVAGARLI
jgi:4-diphosphocytidyl-2-C-methyl-D-erythritol kinase